MNERVPHYSKEEHARLGTELYENRIRKLVEVGNEGKIVAIDVDSGDYEVASDTLSAAERLMARLSDPQIWLVRIGYPSLHRFGFRRPKSIV